MNLHEAMRLRLCILVALAAVAGVDAQTITEKDNPFTFTVSELIPAAPEWEYTKNSMSRDKGFQLHSITRSWSDFAVIRNVGIEKVGDYNVVNKPTSDLFIFADVARNSAKGIIGQHLYLSMTHEGFPEVNLVIPAVASWFSAHGLDGVLLAAKTDEIPCLVTAMLLVDGIFTITGPAPIDFRGTISGTQEALVYMFQRTGIERAEAMREFFGPVIGKAATFSGAQGLTKALESLSHDKYFDQSFVVHNGMVHITFPCGPQPGPFHEDPRCRISLRESGSSSLVIDGDMSRGGGEFGMNYKHALNVLSPIETIQPYGRSHPVRMEVVTASIAPMGETPYVARFYRSPPVPSLPLSKSSYFTPVDRPKPTGPRPRDLGPTMRRLLCDMLSGGRIEVAVPSLSPNWDYTGSFTIGKDEKGQIIDVLGECSSRE